MQKSKQLKLYVIPEKDKPFGEWEYVWAERKPSKKYVRVKDLKKKGY